MTKNSKSTFATYGFFDNKSGFSSGVFKSLNVKNGIGDTVQNVAKNRQLALSKINSSTDSLVFLNDLIHSDKVFVAKEASASDIDGYDSVITNVPKLAIALSVADCLPIVLIDQQSKSIGLIHAGWKGLKKGIIAKTVEAMIKEYGSQPKNIRAIIGPSVCVDCYEVGDKFLENFDEKFYMLKNDMTFLDLAAIAKSQLDYLGIDSVEKNRICVSENTNFFSYRRDNGKTGRNLAVAIIN